MDAPRVEPPEAPLAAAEDMRCELCGASDAKEYYGRRLCEECFQVCGSCCMEFGDRDLWKDVLQD